MVALKSLNGNRSRAITAKQTQQSKRSKASSNEKIAAMKSQQKHQHCVQRELRRQRGTRASKRTTESFY